MSQMGERIQTSNKPRNIREHNLKLVLQLFRQQEILSIHQIAQQASLSKTTVTKVVSLLLAQGLVVSVGKGASTEEGGKKPELFALNTEKAYIISLSTGVGVISGAVLDLKCRLLYRHDKAYDPGLNYPDTLERVAEVIGEMLSALSLSHRQICGIALGCDGVVDAENGILRYPIHHKWGKELPIAEDLLRILPYDVPIWVDNACRFLGYAEMVARGGAAQECMVTVFSAGGTGGCIIQHGRIIKGSNGFVGELGHFILDTHSDVLCQCGNYGCFEALVSPRQVLARVREAAPDKLAGSSLAPAVQAAALSIDDVFAAAQEGDALAREALDPVVGCFAALIHNTILLLDPQEIVIQGVYARAGDYFLERLRTQVRSFRFYKIKHKLDISYSRLKSSGDYLADFLLGGGYYVAEMFFSQYDFRAMEKLETAIDPRQ